MAESTAISWTDATFNPWIGCTKVSMETQGGGGCDNCYAATLDANRFSKTLRPAVAHWGAGAPRHRTKTWGDPVKWNKRDFVQCADCGWRGDHEDFMQQDVDGLRSHCSVCGHEAYIAARRRVFCASLADVFDNEVDPQWREDLFELIRATPNLDWLLLTKRIGNVPAMVAIIPGWLPENVWLGATIVNQEEADRDIPKLLATPARVRFLSMEPLLGPVDLSYLPGADGWRIEALRGTWERRNHSRAFDEEPNLERNQGGPKIDWVIVGGESGAKARPMHPDWARSLRDQCAAAGVPLHFKQWGKQAAGRLLDGVTHNAFPEAH